MYFDNYITHILRVLQMYIIININYNKHYCVESSALVAILTLRYYTRSLYKRD